MGLLSRLFPNMVWVNASRCAGSYKPYDELPEAGKKAIRDILGVKRFTSSVPRFEYQSLGIWLNSVQFCVPGDFGSFPPFDYDDPKYPGLAAVLHKAYEE